MPSSGDLPDPGIEAESYSSCIGRQVLDTSTTWEVLEMNTGLSIRPGRFPGGPVVRVHLPTQVMQAQPLVGELRPHVLWGS